MNPRYSGHCVLVVRHAQPAKMAGKATPAALAVAAHPFRGRGKPGHAINHRGHPKSRVGPCLTRSLLLLVWIDAKLASSGRGARYASPARCRTAGQRRYETQAPHTMRTVLNADGAGCWFSHSVTHAAPRTANGLPDAKTATHRSTRPHRWHRNRSSFRRRRPRHNRLNSVG
jgi:hypothetical protein